MLSPHELSPDELADPERSFNRLLFAAQDMAECYGAVDCLQQDKARRIPGDVQPNADQPVRRPLILDRRTEIRELAEAQLNRLGAAVLYLADRAEP